MPLIWLPRQNKIGRQRFSTNKANVRYESKMLYRWLSELSNVKWLKSEKPMKINVKMRRIRIHRNGTTLMCHSRTVYQRLHLRIIEWNFPLCHSNYKRVKSRNKTRKFCNYNIFGTHIDLCLIIYFVKMWTTHIPSFLLRLGPFSVSHFSRQITTNRILRFTVHETHCFLFSACVVLWWLFARYNNI